MSVQEYFKSHWQGYEQNPDLIVSKSTTKFIGKIHSTPYRTVKAHQAKPSNKTKQNPYNQNSDEFITI